ncbi:MAG: hypothetical protein ABI237_07200 [Ginsengibacter sp.]
MKCIKFSGVQFLLIFFFSFFAACTGKQSDDEIQQSINAQLSGNENYKGVTDSISGRTVLLTGSCEGENCAIEVEKIIKENKYVDSVMKTIFKKTMPSL